MCESSNNQKYIYIPNTKKTIQFKKKKIDQISNIYIHI